MISWLHDLRYALRQLRKSPGFTVAAVLTLAMAIGANAVVFSVMNGFILRPLNVPDAQSLYTLERASDKDTAQSYPDYRDLRDRDHSFDSLAAFGITQVAMNTGGGSKAILPPILAPLGSLKPTDETFSMISVSAAFVGSYSYPYIAPAALI